MLNAQKLFNVKSLNFLITGSSGGLGYTFAEGLAVNGAKIFLNGRNEEKLNEAANRLMEKGYDVHPYAFDVNNPGEVKKIVIRIEQEHGRIDVLVNNAGINIRSPLEDYPDEAWNNVIGTNLNGAYYVSKSVVNQMISRRQGKIINICSMQSELGRPTIAPYAAAKGGLKMLTKAMAVEWGKHNIQVNGIGPGYFKTEMTRALYEDRDFDKWLCSRTPSNRWGEPEELLGAILFLSSPSSNYINGHIIYVDGGLLASI